MAEYEEVDENEFESSEDEEMVELRRIVVLDKKQSYPINGVNEGYSMGDVLAVRHRQGRRYIKQIDNDIVNARWAEDEDNEPEDAYEVPKSELQEELGKVGEVPRLKDKLEAMEG